MPVGVAPMDSMQSALWLVCSCNTFGICPSAAEDARTAAAPPEAQSHCICQR
eukprot:CAMPEP_0178429888 /NCGR_PEP_ID=MMETSP0689_2-20121128/31036_1 /TAXON_ID=160604 /ORGANISM="Amphidinium massartii, Strain CS-259" /LENGTH=51 /DNA_ID=CAMNT_0020051727 /DNA_START=330 /DNA_END=485 /DNA_ORIENTATION=-